MAERKEFNEIWQTLDIDSSVQEFAETQTMAPSEQTRITPSRGRPLAKKLPKISGSKPTDTMPEVEFGRKLGEGGTAEVVAAQQVPLGREVAVKRLRPDRNIDEAMYVLLQEAWVTGRLEHPNIVPIYRLGRNSEGQPVIVMKRIEGVAWDDLLKDPSLAPRDFDSDDPLDWHIDILMEVCDAVHYAHNQQIIHRDLKPENVMVGGFGEVYVVDWGLAVSVADNPSERLPGVAEIGEPAGTPAYMAPEMAEGEADRHGLQTDVYLLGGILHRIVTGEPPHQGESLFDIMLRAYHSEPKTYGDDVPSRLADICNRAMSRDPRERFESAESFRRALVEFKRSRQSIELSGHAHARLDEFRDMLDDETEGEAALYETFGECRFGFERALEVDDTNDEAREGLQEVMELMIEREMAHDGYKAASLLIAELPEPRPELEEKLEALKSELKDREREYEKLKEFEKERDVDRGRKTRSVFLLIVGLLLGGLSYAPNVLQSFVGVDLGYGDLFFQSTIVGLILGAALFIGRRSFFQNVANQQLVISLMWIFGGILILRKTAMKTGIALESIMATEMVLASVAAGVIAVCLDKRVFWAAVPYAIGGILAADFQSHVYLIDALTDIVALSSLAFVWWPGRFESLAGPITAWKSESPEVTTDDDS